jgi:benzoyl-CoA reductase/2-hydroxyglutaryl-CoA dehydratase subunit BcrC/BadD/HgdB
MSFAEVESIIQPIFKKYRITGQFVFSPAEYLQIAEQYTKIFELDEKLTLKKFKDEVFTGIINREKMLIEALDVIGNLSEEPPTSILERQLWSSQIEQRVKAEEDLDVIQNQKEELNGELNQLTQEIEILMSEMNLEGVY